MEETEDQCGGLGVGLKAEPALIRTQIIQRLVDDGQSYNRVDNVAVDADVEVHAQEHGGGVAERKQADIDRDVLHPVEEKHDPQKEQQMIITGDHVFGPEVHEGNEIYAGYFLDVSLVTLGNGMGQHLGAHTEQY